MATTTPTDTGTDTGDHPVEADDLSREEQVKDVAELSKGKERVFQKPVIHGDEGAEARSASWLELFFDLFFVAAIARIAHHLAYHFGTYELMKFLVVFAALWWVWMSDTYYNIRFETKGALQRIYVAALMFPVLAMAIFGTATLTDQMLGFAAAFAVARLINGFMWGRAAWHLPRARAMIKWILLTMIVSLSVLSLVLVVPQGWILPVLAASVFISIAGAGLSTPAQLKLPALPRDKLPERHGLFMIIILGETIVPLAVPPEDMTSTALVLQIGAGILMAIGFWWTYFDFVARRPPRRALKWFMLWGYMHLPLAVALTLNGVGVAMVIDGAEHAATVLLCAAGVSLLAVAALEWPVEHGEAQPYPFPESALLKVGLGGGLLALAFLADPSSDLAIGAVLLSLLVCVVYSTYRFATADAEELEEFEA